LDVVRERTSLIRARTARFLRAITVDQACASLVKRVCIVIVTKPGR
jgi:hypothetical protein